MSPRRIPISRCLRDKLRATIHRGKEREVSGQGLPGGIFESALEAGMSRKGPLRPHKGQVSPLITMPRCAEQSSPGACHFSIVCSVSFGHLLSQVFCLSPLRCLLEMLGVILSNSAFGAPRPGADTIDPLTPELGGASESHLSLEASSRTSFTVSFRSVFAAVCRNDPL